MDSSQPEQQANPRNLNVLLDTIENKLGRLSFGLGNDAFTILEDLDAAKKRLEQADQQGTDTRAETAQFESICAVLRKDAGQFLRQVGGQPGLAARRAMQTPPKEHWWWYLDEVYVQSRKQSMLNGLRTVMIAAIVLGFAALIYRLFLTPDPQVIAVLNAQQSIERYFIEDNLDQALTEVEKGLVEVPDSPELLIYKAAILEAMGKNAEAGTVYTQAQSIIQNDEIFTLNRAQVYLVMNNAADTVAILEQYVLENRSSAKAFLLLGTAYELQNDQVKAIEAYEMASEVGNQIEDSTTVAQARIKLAMLMQSFGLNQLETSTPELTP